MNKEIEYNEKSITTNIRKYLRKMIIIKRANSNDIISKNIEETMAFSESINKMLEDGIDIDQDLYDEVTSVLNEIILITNFYKFTEELRKESNKKNIDEFEKKINLLIREKIKELEMSI